MIYEKRGQYCFRWEGQLYKFPSGPEARECLSKLEGICQSKEVNEEKTQDLSESELADTTNQNELQNTKQNHMSWLQKSEIE